MRQGFSSRRSRNRNGRKQYASPKPHTFDSNGPDVRVRGTASQVIERYLALARDATASGDRVAAEGYYQHAEHYYRVLNGDGGGNGGGGAKPRTNDGIEANAEASAGEAAGERAAAPDKAASDGNATDPEGTASV